MSGTNSPLRIVVVAESQQQRMAFSDTVLAWGMELIDCISGNQLTEKHFNTNADVWLIDAETDFEIIQNLEIDRQKNQEIKPKIVLFGFTPAPYINSGLPYEKWQRKLKRKIANSLNRFDLLEKTKTKLDDIATWKYVVMLGASMGGPVAVKEFLDNLPNDLPIALILAQHFNPASVSTLPRILTRQNNWRCKVAYNTQKILAGQCLIVPIECSVVFDSTGRMILQKEGWQGSYQPSISQVLTTCSNVFGNHFMSIIFSGMGDDGSDVAHLVKKNGSVIWAQTPETSACPSQPKSMIDTGMVDFVGSPKELAEALVSLCKRSCLPDGSPIFLAPNPQSY